jgi:hypothetical protein
MSDGKTTDAEINEALARKIGWVESPLTRRWYPPNEVVSRGCDAPDYFCNPAASAELEDWLLANGWNIETQILSYITRAEISRVDDLRRGSWQVSYRASSARCRCLAMAAHFALCAPTGGPDAT